MKEIIEQLQKLGITTTLTLNTPTCRAAFFYQRTLIGEVFMDNLHGNHSTTSILKGLKTNYEWKGLNYKLPMQVKNLKKLIQEEKEIPAIPEIA